MGGGVVSEIFRGLRNPGDSVGGVVGEIGRVISIFRDIHSLISRFSNNKRPKTYTNKKVTPKKKPRPPPMYQEIQLGDDKLNTVTTFKYLGSIFDSNGVAERDIYNG